MRLLDYMRAERVSDEEIAERIGNCTGHAVKKWKYGERDPDSTTIARIEGVTGGRVTFVDWVTQAAERQAKRPPRLTAVRQEAVAS